MSKARRSAHFAASSACTSILASRKQVHFDLKPRDLSMVTEVGERIIPEGKYSLSIGGGQPTTGAPTMEGTFQMEGSVVLPD